MISWIQNRLIKNGKWIFSILLAVTIVSFVFVIGETPGITTPEFGGNEQQFYGVNLRDSGALEVLDRQTMLVTMLQGGNTRFSAQNIRQLSLYRVTALHLADQYKIPLPPKEKLQEFILDMPLFKNQQGAFDPDAYQQFLDTVQNNPSITTGMLDRAIQDEYRIQKVTDLLSGQGYVTPYDVALLDKQNQTEWTIQYTTRRYSEFNPEIQFTEEDLQAYYENNAFRYETPLKRFASWIYFPAEAFLEEVPDPGDEVLLEHLEAFIYRFLNSEEDRDPENPDQVLEPEALLEKRRAEVLKDWRTERAEIQARIRAEDFATEIYDQDLTQNSEVFKGMVESLGLETGSFEPISRETPPRMAGEGATWDIVESIQGLNPSLWFTDAIAFQEGYGIFYLTGIEEPKIPTLETVREEVERDYRESLRRKQFNETGSAIAEAIRANLEAGLPFDLAAVKSPLEPFDTIRDRLYDYWVDEVDLREIKGREKFSQIKQARPFTRNTFPQILPEGILNAIQGLEPGEITEMVTIRNLGYFIYVQEKVAPELTPDLPRYAQTRETLELSTSNFLTRNALNELFENGIPPGMNLQGVTP